MVAWPGSLPQVPMAAGYSESPPNTLLRTQMDTGAPKTRQKATAAERPGTWPFVLTAAQVATLDTFYETTMAGGSLAFDLNHPRTGAAESWKFAAPPKYVGVSALGGTAYRVLVQVRMQP